jgi:hypothetical protein
LSQTNLKYYVLFRFFAKRFAYRLVFNGSSNGASISTASAANALISVDYVLAIAFGDAAGRASISASTARNALVSNLVCHWGYLHLICILYLFYHITKKNQEVFIKKYIF